MNLTNTVTSDALLNKVMQLFNELMEKYTSTTYDVAFIIGKYIEVIDKSTELTPEQKQSIKGGLSTALYSSEYWESTFNEELK